MVDTDGNIYSYGRHYPLLFEVEGLTFVNVAGYSNTTSKHISWARQAVDNAIPVKLDYNKDRLPLTLATIRERLNAQRLGIAKQMASKKRTDTWVYKDLFRQLNRVDASISMVG
jgi:hypothetical protein